MPRIRPESGPRRADRGSRHDGEDRAQRARLDRYGLGRRSRTQRRGECHAVLVVETRHRHEMIGAAARKIVNRNRKIIACPVGKRQRAHVTSKATLHDTLLERRLCTGSISRIYSGRGIGIKGIGLRDGSGDTLAQRKHGHYANELFGHGLSDSRCIDTHSCILHVVPRYVHVLVAGSHDALDGSNSQEAL
jgi:hypothetical protein